MTGDTSMIAVALYRGTISTQIPPTPNPATSTNTPSRLHLYRSSSRGENARGVGAAGAGAASPSNPRGAGRSVAGLWVVASSPRPRRESGGD
jgi:hypothetical protein